MNILSKITTGVRMVRLFRNWPCPFLSYFGLLKNAEVVYVLRNGIKFKVGSAEDWTGIFVIWSGRVWTPFGHEIQPGYTVVDIGAHIGIFSILAATCMPSVKVVSYEPCPKNFSLLVENIKLNSVENIRPFPLAVAGSSGKRKLFVSQQDVAHSIIQPAANSQLRAYEDVDCITLKEIIGQIGKCDFLKINCEGAEYEILFNTPTEYLNKVGKMSIDCHNTPGYSGYDLKSYLEKTGFQLRLVQTRTGSHIYLYATNKMGTSGMHLLGGIRQADIPVK